jgi:hypothetical protein
MQLSRATDQADPTGALLLPVEAVASAEPAQTLARDGATRGRTSELPIGGSADVMLSV